MTVYYSGLDVNAHSNPNYLTQGASHLQVTDRCLGKLIRCLELYNLLGDAKFIFTGDHGLSRYGFLPGQLAYNAKRSLLLEDDLEIVFTNAGYDVLDFAAEQFYNSVFSPNGGMAHVYVKECSCSNSPRCDTVFGVSNSWAAAPRFIEDVLPLAERFYNNSADSLEDPDGNPIDLDNPTLKGFLDLVLVRDSEGAGGWNAPYQVLTKDTNGDFETISITTALARLLPDWRYVDILTNMQRLQDIRSGDIILLAADVCANNASGYYFGDGDEIPGWHGSLCETDMTIPIIFSYPEGEDVPGGPQDLTQFMSTVQPMVNLDPRITVISPTVFKLLTNEDMP